MTDRLLCHIRLWDFALWCVCAWLFAEIVVAFTMGAETVLWWL